ncbi:N-acetylmuramoyl-L-alanine amidase [Luteimonas kalidii]|uniref:N-acetylmuramoyl-L-alanine amidase n=1 Tax=Luteimonas kalidii TaxID=3042025 RepID=A0ABT6JPL1_9GAMM|nr:N-acetylmuramoyl-L-alanine amidase [Luteimonas kalidii]MDH5832624.1 N-acetylmuramoyl-L-alanine amidase [Luteimonas kalidii]
MPTRIRLAILCACALALAACQHGAPRNPMATWVASDNFDTRRAQVIVLHYTEQDSVAQSLRTLRTRNSGGPVSSHYLVGDDGEIYQLVSDEHRAWHAGAGSWGTIHELNSASIGIEIDNDGIEPFSEPQVAALLRLLDDLTSRHRIPKDAVIGHSDLAPGRKIDPGPLFPWKRLADAGYGAWPDPAAPRPPPGFDPVQALRLVGYPVDNLEAAIHSYRMRFRGDNAKALDAEDLRILHALTWRRSPVSASGEAGAP